MTFDPNTYIEDWKDAWTAGDVDRLVAYAADDLFFRDPFHPDLQQGKARYHATIQQYFDAFDLMDLVAIQVVRTGKEIGMLLRMRVTHTGDLVVSPKHTMPASKITIDVTFANFLTIDGGGRVLRSETIFDTRSVIEGLTPKKPQL